MEEIIDEKKLTKKKLEKKLKGSACCLVGRHKYIDEINKRLLAGVKYPQIYNWLHKIGERIGKETLKKHSKHFLDPSINPKIQTKHKKPSKLKKISKTSKKKKKAKKDHILDSLKLNREKSPLELMKHAAQTILDRFESCKEKEEDDGNLTSRGDKLAVECFKVAKELHQLTSERQSNEEYYSAELVIIMVDVFKKFPIFQNLKTRQEITQGFQNFLLNAVVEGEKIEVEMKEVKKLKA